MTDFDTMLEAARQDVNKSVDAYEKVSVAKSAADVNLASVVASGAKNTLAIKTQGDSDAADAKSALDATVSKSSADFDLAHSKEMSDNVLAQTQQDLAAAALAPARADVDAKIDELVALKSSSHPVVLPVVGN